MESSNIDVTDEDVHCIVLKNLKKSNELILNKFGFNRIHQINKLTKLIGDFKFTVPVIQVIGPPGTGKTGLLRDYFKFTKLAHAYVDCSNASFESTACDIDGLSNSILRCLRSTIISEWKHYCGSTSSSNENDIKIPHRVANTYKFMSSLRKLLSYSHEKLKKYNAAIILDNAHQLLEHDPNFFTALLKHKENFGIMNADVKHQQQFRSIFVILVSRDVLPTDFLSSVVSPISIRFDAYDKESCKEILKKLYHTIEGTHETTQSHTSMQSHDKNKEELMNCNGDDENSQIQVLWLSFVNEFVNITYNEFKRDFKEMLFLCRHMWKITRQSIDSLTDENSVRHAFQTMKQDTGNHAKTALMNYCSHFISDLVDPLFCKGSTTNYHRNADVELSFIGRLLVVGAAIAFYTDRTFDSQLLNQINEKHTNSRRRKRPSNYRRSKSIRNNPFTFARWLAITDCLSHIVVDCHLEINSFLYAQVTSLLKLRLVSIWHASEKLGSVSKMATMQRSAVYYSDLTYIDAFGEPYLSSASATTAQRRSNEAEQLQDLLDPYTKLFCQVPLEMIKEIANKLPNIKLEELIDFA